MKGVRAGTGLIAAALVLSFAAGGGTAGADPAPGGNGRIDAGRLDAARVDAAFGQYDKPGSPGCAVGVVESGTIVFARGYGEASLEHAVPITPRTMFDLGSTSKQITSAAVALLVLDGKLSLDDPIRKYFPEIRDFKRSPAITVRRLLDHTSGLRDYTDLLSMEGHAESDLTTTPQGFEILARQKGLNFPAGDEFRYTNSGHFLASILVKRVSGKSLRDFARERIFGPLGMTESTYFDDHTLIVPRRAAGYSPRDGGGFEVAMSDWEQVGDGGVQSSIEEMALWATNLDTGEKLGGRPLVDLLHTPGKLADGTPIPYGLGLFLGTHRGLKLVEHGGAWAGYRANLMRVPERRLAVITLCNVSTAATGKLSMAALDAALDGLPESERPAPEAPPATAPPASGKPAAAATLASYAGVYVSEHLGDVGTVEAGPDGLRLSGEPLLPRGEGRFAVASSSAIITFAANGEMRIEDVRENPRPAIFRKVSPPPSRTEAAGAGAPGAKPAQPPARPAGASPGTPAGSAKPAGPDLAGTYRADDLLSGCEVEKAEERLEFSCGGGEASTMTPLGGDLYDLGWGLLKARREPSGAVESLTLTTRGLVDFVLHRIDGPAVRGEGRGSRGV
ncbi:MAG TPA: serine hydrolase domain-containing protein [Candidatus Polarisedimenticolia bacterium]|nr:serine hydrolase domain-containing protein [Candidatus Polarisedimenticolia bacterium]